MYKKVIVRDTERAIVIENGRFSRILTPGQYKLGNLFRSLEIHTFNVIRSDVPEDIESMISAVRPDLAKELFATVNTGEGEVAIVYFDGRPFRVFGPWKRSAFWKVSTNVEIKVINTADVLRLTNEQKKAIVTSTSTLVEDVIIQQHEAGLLFVDGRLVEELKPGHHAFWTIDRKVRVATIDLRPLSHEITAQEILTKDRVSIRITLTAFTKVTNPRRVTEETSDYATYVYRLVQFAVREAVANRTLDEILNNRETVDQQIRDHVDKHIGDIGVDVKELGIKDIILPGDMRELINRVVEAEKVAQANLIKRREETAATRSLLNTARLMEDNPLLLRLKELETLERLIEKVGNIDLVTGRDTPGFDGLLNNLLQLNNKANDKS
ncbi:MAG: slipin family protein [Methyloligellaceae bacterium]